MDRSAYLKVYRQKYKAHAKRVNLTLTNEEHQALLHAAQAHKMPLTAFAKQLTLSALADQDVPLPIEIETMLAERMALLRSIANNFNQVARLSNTIGEVRDAQMPLMLLHRLETEFHEALKALRHGPDCDPANAR